MRPTANQQQKAPRQQKETSKKRQDTGLNNVLVFGSFRRIGEVCSSGVGVWVRRRASARRRVLEAGEFERLTFPEMSTKKNPKNTHPHIKCLSSTPRNVTKCEIERTRASLLLLCWRHPFKSQTFGCWLPPRTPGLPHDKHGGGTCHNKGTKVDTAPSAPLPHFLVAQEGVPAHTQNVSSLASASLPAHDPFATLSRLAAK
jgi:hypothetical protein